jgi:peptidoglycan/LPS O-acetylase OafA/YrhL
MSPTPHTPRWLRPFQRVTSQGEHVREIDGLRFIALAMVVLLHLNHYVVLDATVDLKPEPSTSVLGRLLDQGDFGVQVFFVISGFILSVPFARQNLMGGQPVLLKHYFLRRLTRLEPPLLVNLSLLLLLMVVALKRPLGELGPHFLASCGYLHSALYGQPSLINPMTWSLEVEAQFYLAMPLLAWLFRVRGLALRQGLLFGLITAMGLLPWHLPKASLLAQLEYFLVGMALADVWLTCWREAPVKTQHHDLTAAAAWLGFFSGLYWNRWLPIPGVLLPLCLFLCFRFSLRSALISRLLAHWLPVTIGGMCYTIYLYHLAIISAMSRLTTRWIQIENYPLNYAVHALVILPVVLITCMAFFLLIEKPFMRWRPWRRQAVEPAVTADVPKASNDE